MSFVPDEVGDVPAITAALARLDADRELGSRLGAAGREHTLPRYRVDRLVDDVEALYRELLGESGLVP